jgi:HPt (histidine-containing phosphotransfer) domain-containing protein
MLPIYVKDAEKRLPMLQTVPDAQALPLFVTQVHALKSASASIGAADVSALAAELEAAGKAGDMTLIGNRLPAFAGQLAELVKNIRAALKTDAGVTHNEIPPPESSKGTGVGASSVFVSLLRKLEAALKSENVRDIDRVMDEINNKQMDSKTRETLEQISDQILVTEYGSAIASIEKMIAVDSKE